MSDENVPEELGLPKEEPTQPLAFVPENSDITWLTGKVEELKGILSAYVIGQDEVIELMVTGIFSNGHLLLEGVPGVAKTLASKVMSRAMNVGFSRIQFTPDLMPSDVIGTSVFNMKDASFSFKKGPVFSNIVLIDEINRAPAKTQAALFEVMEERQITYDGQRYEMEFPFLVVATQNPVEQEGTYNLPEAQLDRFLFRIKMHYPDQQEEEQILFRYRDNLTNPDLNAIQPALDASDIKRIQEIIEQVRIEEKLLTYIAAITMKTRGHGRIYLGGSPRASLSMLKASKALSVLRGRDFVTPEDIQYVAKHVLNHRLILTPEAEMEGVTAEEVIQEIISTIEVPR